MCLTFFSGFAWLVFLPTFFGLLLLGTIQMALHTHKSSGFLYFEFHFNNFGKFGFYLQRQRGCRLENVEKVREEPELYKMNQLFLSNNYHVSTTACPFRSPSYSQFSSLVNMSQFSLLPFKGEVEVTLKVYLVILFLCNLMLLRAHYSIPQINSIET